MRTGRVDGTGGRNIEGSTRGPRGPKKKENEELFFVAKIKNTEKGRNIQIGCLQMVVIKMWKITMLMHLLSIFIWIYSIVTR